MPTKKTVSLKNKKTINQKSVPVQPLALTRVQKLRNAVMKPCRYIVRRVRTLLARRPHRSFHRSRRRDYVRSLKMPGYWSFTNYVRKLLWQQKKLFIWLVILYGVLTVCMVGMASQDIFTQLSDTLRSTGGQVFQGNWGEVGKAGLLLVTSVSGSLNSSLTEPQQIYAAIIILFTWLTTVWLLRAVLAGRKPKLRDGLYNAGAPILPTFFVGILLLVQLFPIAIAVIGFGAATSTGLLDGGVEAMLFWTVALLLVALSLYWITSTLIALVVVTLPGMYPMQAIKTAGDLVIGRRVRILLRFLWLSLMVLLLWVIIMVPIILLNTWLNSIWPAIAWLPVVPIALLVMGTLTVIWVASYVYLLYRRVVDDDAAPA